MSSTVNTKIEWVPDSFAIDPQTGEYLKSFTEKYPNESKHPTKITDHLKSDDSDVNGYTLLCYACAKGIAPEIIAWLLNNGASSIKCSRGKTPLQLACLSMNTDVVKVLLGQKIEYAIKEWVGAAKTEVPNGNIGTIQVEDSKKLQVTSKDLLTAASLHEGDLLHVLLKAAIDDISNDELNNYADQGQLYQKIYNLIKYTCDTDGYGNTLLILATQAQNYKSIDYLKDLNDKYGLINTDTETNVDVPIKDGKKTAYNIAKQLLEDDGIASKIDSFHKSSCVLDKFGKGWDGTSSTTQNLTLDNLIQDGFYPVFKLLIYDKHHILSTKITYTLSWFNDISYLYRQAAFVQAYSYISDEYDSVNHTESPFGFGDLKDKYNNLVYALATASSRKLSKNNFKDIDDAKDKSDTEPVLDEVYSKIKDNYTALENSKRSCLISALLGYGCNNLVHSIFKSHSFTNSSVKEYEIANKYDGTDLSAIDSAIKGVLDNDSKIGILEYFVEKLYDNLIKLSYNKIKEPYSSLLDPFCRIIVSNKDNRKTIIMSVLSLKGAELHDILYVKKESSSTDDCLTDAERADIVSYTVSKLDSSNFNSLIAYIITTDKGITNSNLSWLNDNINDSIGNDIITAMDSIASDSSGRTINEKLFKLIVDGGYSTTLSKLYLFYTTKNYDYYYDYVDDKIRLSTLNKNIDDALVKCYTISNCIDHHSYYIISRLSDLTNLTEYDDYTKINNLSINDIKIVYSSYRNAETSGDWNSSVLKKAVDYKLYNTVDALYSMHNGFTDIEINKIIEAKSSGFDPTQLNNSELKNILLSEDDGSEDPSVNELGLAIFSTNTFPVDTDISVIPTSTTGGWSYPTNKINFTILYDEG